MKVELEEYLFREGTYTYAVLDGASVPDLPKKLFEAEDQSTCLYRGELSDELIHVAPYLVQLRKGSDLSNLIMTESWGRHWGIFAQSEYSLSTMKKHFRSLLIVDDEAGNSLLFRYYDPRVLVPYVFTCFAEELKLIFGPVKYYFAESFDRSEMFRMHLANDALVETRLSFGGANRSV
jgi:hypothetical protein